MSNIKWILFVSSRFIKKDRTRMILIAAVSVSVAALISVLSIMNGLQERTINSLIQIGSYHLIVSARMSQAEQREVLAVLEDVRFKSMTPFVELHTVAHTLKSDFVGVTVRGVDDAAANDAGLITQLNIIAGNFDLSGRRVVIGHALARNLGVTVGDSFYLYGHSGQNKDFQVGGVFYSQYAEFDSGFMFMQMDNARAHINSASPINIGIKYRDVGQEAHLMAVVYDRIHPVFGERATLVDWRASNIAILSALKLEKIFIAFVLGMIFIIVAINMYQSLTRKAHRYRREIAILKMYGATPHHAQFSIAYMGLYVGIIGGVCGVACGLWLALNVNGIFRIMEVGVNVFVQIANVLIILLNASNATVLPYVSNSLFFLDDIEYRVLLFECVAIFIFAVITSLTAAYLAARKSAIVRPIHVLRGV